MLILDMTGELRKMLAVKMYQLAAAKAFQMEMAAALLIVLNILIAGTGLSIECIFAHKPLLNKSVKLPVNGRYSDIYSDTFKMLADVSRGNVLSRDCF